MIKMPSNHWGEERRKQDLWHWNRMQKEKKAKEARKYREELAKHDELKAGTNMEQD